MADELHPRDDLADAVERNDGTLVLGIVVEQRPARAAQSVTPGAVQA